jgi:hypothetical protein
LAGHGQAGANPFFSEDRQSFDCQLRMVELVESSHPEEPGRFRVELWPRQTDIFADLENVGNDFRLEPEPGNRAGQEARWRDQKVGPGKRFFRSCLFGCEEIRQGATV